MVFEPGRQTSLASQQPSGQLFASHGRHAPPKQPKPQTVLVSVSEHAPPSQLPVDEQTRFVKPSRAQSFCGGKLQAVIVSGYEH